MKKFIETILLLASAFSLILAGGERPDGSCDIWWTLGWLCVAAISGLAWWRFFNVKQVHVDEDAYRELQRQIQDAVDEIEDEHKTIVVDAALQEGYAIYLTIEIRSGASNIKFTDDAWGATQTFTEYNWFCNCEITKVSVLDKYGNERESDFDDGLLELDFETTDWR